MDRPWTACRDGLMLTIRLTPKSGRDAVEGVEVLADGRSVLKARVRAAPSGGEANSALIALLAATLRMAPRDIVLVAGATSRIKRLLIRGDADALASAMARLCAPVI